MQFAPGSNELLEAPADSQATCSSPLRLILRTKQKGAACKPPSAIKDYLSAALEALRLPDHLDAAFIGKAKRKSAFSESGRIEQGLG